MSWEVIKREPGGRSFGVTVSWRVPGGRVNPAMAVSLGKDTSAQLGLKSRVPGQRVVVLRNRMAGKLRISLPDGHPPDETRSVAWKGDGCTVTVPLDDVTLAVKKPAQDVQWSFVEGGRFLEIKLPAWACPLIKVVA